MNIWDYLFSASPGVVGSGAKILALFLLGAILIIMHFIIPVIRRNTDNKALKKTLARSRVGSLSFGLGAVFLAWMRVEQVPLLSMRIWIVLLLVGLIVWGVWKTLWYSKTKTRIHNSDIRRGKK